MTDPSIVSFGVAPPREEGEAVVVVASPPAATSSSIASKLRGPAIGFLFGCLASSFAASKHGGDPLRAALNAAVGSGGFGRFLVEEEEGGEFEEAESTKETDEEEGAGGGRWSKDEEEEGEDEEEEEGMETHESFLLATAILFTIFLLIVLTIGFETTKERIEERAGRHMAPIVESLFGEMTVLGFLSVVTFVLTQSGCLEPLSERMFDEEGLLLEVVEAVHYTLFGVMVFFVANVLFLVREAKKTEEEWLEMDHACRDEGYMATLSVHQEKKRSVVDNGRFRRFARWFRGNHLTRSKRNDSIEDQTNFHSLRNEFLLERSPDPPFEPTDPESRLPDDFNFGSYLSKCLVHDLAHVVHLKPSTWWALAALTAVCYGVRAAVLFSKRDDDVLILSWCWAGFAYCVIAFDKNMYRHHLKVRSKLVCDPAAAPPSSADDGIETQSMLPPTPSEEGTYGTDADAAKGDPSASALRRLPPWCSVDLDEYLSRRRPLLAKIFCSGTTPTRMDTLHWLERKGPHLYLLLSQIVLVFAAVYISVAVIFAAPSVYRRGSTTSFVAYLVVAFVVPIPVIRVTKRHVVATMVQVSCVGPHRKPQVVADVVQQEKTVRIVRAFIVLYKLQHAAERGLDDEEERRRFDGPERRSPADLDSVEASEVSKTFDAFDHSKDGTISTDEFRQVMTSLGSPISDDRLRAMLSVLDADGDDEVTKDEFLRFYADHVAGMDAGMSPEERGRFIFGLFDRDGNGEVTVGEFKNALDAFGVEFTVDEVGKLVNELDEKGVGTLGHEEFERLLLQYEPLLKDYEVKDVRSYSDYHLVT